MNDLPPFFSLGGSVNPTRENKKAKIQANLVRMRRDSHLSEKERRRQERISSMVASQTHLVPNPSSSS
jgi:hypothetical protein